MFRGREEGMGEGGKVKENEDKVHMKRRYEWIATKGNAGGERKKLKEKVDGKDELYYYE